MATTTKNQYTGDGTTSLFPFTFPYIEESDVVVKVDGVVQTIITEYIIQRQDLRQDLTFSQLAKVQSKEKPPCPKLL